MITGAAQCTYLEEVLKRGGAGRRGFYRDGGAIMCGARRAMSGEIGYEPFSLDCRCGTFCWNRYLVRYFGMLQPSLTSFLDSKLR